MKPNDRDIDREITKLCIYRCTEYLDFSDCKSVNKWFTGFGIFFCGLVTVVTTTLYIHNAEYQPIFYPADILYLFAVSASVHYLRIDSQNFVYFFVSLCLSALTAIMTAVAISVWDDADSVYQGTTMPFTRVTQTTYAPYVDVDVYTLRYFTILFAGLCSVIHLMAELSDMPHNTKIKTYYIWVLVFIPFFVLLCRVIMVLLDYPRMERADSVHFVLISGTILSLRATITTIIWLSVGLIFSTLYVATLDNEACFLNVGCYQANFGNDTYVIRVGVGSIPHIYGEMTWASQYFSILLIFVGYFVWLFSLIIVSYQWISYIKRLNRPSSYSEVKSSEERS